MQYSKSAIETFIKKLMGNKEEFNIWLIIGVNHDVFLTSLQTIRF